MSSPCGRGGEFIRQISKSNLDAHVILGSDKVVLLRDLLPENEWPQPLE
jgi:cytidine deaminase